MDNRFSFRVIEKVNYDVNNEKTVKVFDPKGFKYTTMLEEIFSKQYKILKGYI